MEEKVDYKALYYQLFANTEQAIRTLVEAQRACEESYLKQQEETCHEEKSAETTGEIAG